MEMSFCAALLAGILYDSALALTLCRVRPNLVVLCSITLTSADWSLNKEKRPKHLRCFVNITVILRELFNVQGGILQIN